MLTDDVIFGAGWTYHITDDRWELYDSDATVRQVWGYLRMLFDRTYL